MTRLLFPVLDRGCSADRPQPVFESSIDILFFKTEKYTYISSKIATANKKDWNLVIWVYHQHSRSNSSFLCSKYEGKISDSRRFDKFSAFILHENVKIVCTYEKIREVAEMQEFFHFNFNQEKFTTGLKQASADETENVYLSFAALLSWNGQLSVLLVKTQWCRN